VTQSIEVTNPGIFSVQIINAAGCITEGTTQVFDARPPVDLGPNITVCEGESIVLDSNVPVATNPPNDFTWFIDGASQGSGPNPTYEVDTGTPGTFEYIVNVVDGLTGCFGTDTVLVTINATPSVTYEVSQSSCGLADGQINVLTPDPLAGLTVAYFDDSSSPIGTGSASPLIAAGVYTLVVTDNISACAQDYAISLTDSIVGFNIDMAVPRQDCAGDTPGCATV
jgi:hypothetical protein